MDMIRNFTSLAAASVAAALVLVLVMLLVGMYLVRHKTVAKFGATMEDWDRVMAHCANCGIAIRNCRHGLYGQILVHVTNGSRKCPNGKGMAAHV